MPEHVVETAGERLDVFVARVAGLSRAQAARLVDAGGVTVNGARASRSARVAQGAVVDVPDEPPREAPVSEHMELAFVHEDDHLVVLSKPAGLVVHPAPGHDAGTLVNALVEHGARGGDADRPGIVHRLDAGTSGLMVVAKDEDVHARLTEMIAAREVVRSYLALVEGRPATDSITIDAPIGRSPRHRQKMAVVAGGKDAITHVTVVERHTDTSLVEARLETGRTHQIRVHMQAARHPVVGDPVYGKDRALARALGLDRPFLHAARLAFEHPATGEQLAFEDPLPPDLEQALERARAVVRVATFERCRPQVTPEQDLNGRYTCARRR